MIPFNIICHSVNIIIDQISIELIEDRMVSIGRFGTLSPYFRLGHLANNVSSGRVQKLPTKRLIKFHPHVSFKNLLKDKHDLFAKDPGQNPSE